MSDLVGQSYLGYVIPSRSQLFLVRLEKTNEQQQIIFGMTTSIVAKDAVSLQVLKRNIELHAHRDGEIIFIFFPGFTYDSDCRFVK